MKKTPKGKFHKERITSALPIEFFMKNNYKKISINILAVKLLFVFAFVFSFPFFANAEEVKVLDKCFNNTCFLKPNDLDIARSGNLAAIVDSGNNHVRVVTYSNNEIKNSKIIKLNTKPASGALFNIKITKDEKKAIVFAVDTPVQIVDINAGTVKSLNITEKVSTLDLLNNDGGKFLIGTNDKNKPELLIVDDNSQIEKRIALKDIPRSINVSLLNDKALVTFKGFESKTLVFYDLKTHSLTEKKISEARLFDFEDFLLKNSFDNSGKYSAISSFGGLFVFYLADLVNNSLSALQLNDSAEGECISDISHDGSFGIGACTYLAIGNGFKLFSLNTKDKKDVKKIIEKTIKDGSVALDVDITPDQSKIYVLVLKNNKRLLKVFKVKDLTEVAEYEVSSDSVIGDLKVDPYGRYALSPDVLLDSSTDECIACAAVQPVCQPGEVIIKQTCNKCAHCGSSSTSSSSSSSSSTGGSGECVVCAQVVPVCQPGQVIINQTCERCSHCE